MSSSRRPAFGGGLREREVQLGAINALVEGLEGDGERTLVLEGAPGIGKTRLLQSAAAAGADAGLAVLAARPGELDTGFAFGVVRDLFEWPLRALDPSERDEVSAGAAGLASSLLRSENGVKSADPFAIRHSLYWLAVNLAARRPLLICLDDAHWADRPSLEWLRHLVRRQKGTSIGLLVASRPAEPGVDLSAVAALRGESGVEVMRPNPLGLTGIESMLTEELGEEIGARLAAPCLKLSAGNPRLVSELASMLAAGEIEANAEALEEIHGRRPARLGQLTLARISGLPGPEEAILKAVAVLGSGSREREVAELCDVGGAEVRDAVANLVELDILVAEGEEIGFVHPLLATGVHEGMTARERNALHRLAAWTLIGAGALPEEIAAQIIQADPAGEERFATVLREAARRAIANGDPPSALPYLRRAKEELAPNELTAEDRIEYGRALLACGQREGANVLRTVLAETRDPGRRASLALELGNGLSAINRYREACQVLRRAVEDLDGSEPELELLLEASLYFAARTLISPDPALLTRIQRFGTDLRGETPGERAMLVVLAGQMVLTGGSPGAASALLARAIQKGPAADDRERVHRGLIARMLVFCDELTLALELLDDLLAEPRTQSSPLVATRCFAAGRQGDIESALADGAVAIEGVESQGLQVQLGIVFASYMEALIQAGRPHEALGIGDRLEAIDDQREISGRVYFLHTRALARAAVGERGAAIADLREVARTIDRWGCDSPGALQWRATLAEQLRLEGAGEEACRLASEELNLARSFGAARPLGVALMAFATTVEEPIPALEEAAVVLERSAARLEHARARVRLGAALRRANRRAEAREQLLQGLDLAARCGSPPLECAAREELAALGARPRRSVRHGIDSLTACEARAARMAARGLQNREIAQTLFVTIKTVETHLSRSYTKLGISSRRQLPEALGESQPESSRDRVATISGSSFEPRAVSRG